MFNDVHGKVGERFEYEEGGETKCSSNESEKMHRDDSDVWKKHDGTNVSANRLFFRGI